jgi:alcohol dehydrogenase class IV
VIINKEEFDSILGESEKTILVTTKSLKEDANILIKNRSIETIIVSAEPTISDVKDYLNQIRHLEFDLIIAIGGGSVIDTTKILASNIDESENIEHDLSQNINFKKLIKSICIPTTAGTGAEVTSFATVWNKEDKKKYSFKCDNGSPDFIYFAPKLLVKLRPDILKFSILDSLAHCLDSALNCARTDESLKNVNYGLGLILNNYSNLKSQSNLKNLLEASYFAGLAINETKTSILHAISYPFTYNHNIPHGLAVGISISKLLDNEKCLQELNSVIAVKDFNVRIRSLLREFNVNEYKEKYINNSYAELLKKYEHEIMASERFKNFYFKDLYNSQFFLNK